MNQKLALAAAILATATLGLVCCKSMSAVDNPVGCVQPPPELLGIERERAAEIGAKVPDAPLEGDVEATFKEQVLVSYRAISDDAAMLAMWLNAIDCYLQRGKAGETAALSLVDFVTNNYSVTTGQGSPGLTLEVLHEIRQTPYASSIEHRLMQFGLLSE